MKICPKCNGFYMDIDDVCQDCNIKLYDKKQYSEIYNELKDMTQHEREQNCYKSKYSAICKYQFGINTHNKNAIKPTSPQQNIPKCPTCGSTNIKRITTLDRAISIGTIGLLSGKIGKNYECLNCKAKW